MQRVRLAAALNLDLWRFTGEVRYLEVADRLLQNQYLTNQCHNGGFGMCHVDGDRAGPIGTDGMLDEWPFCCSFHGPLGLHFLKGYLAAGSDRGVFVNFPLDFTAARSGQWAGLARHGPDEVRSGEKRVHGRDRACPARAGCRRPHHALGADTELGDGLPGNARNGFDSEGRG